MQPYLLIKLEFRMPLCFLVASHHRSSVPNEVDFLSHPVMGGVGREHDCCLGVSQVMETHSQPANGNAGSWTPVMSWVGGVWKGIGRSHSPTPMQLESDKMKSICLRDS